jgi:hypothetical protein
LFFGPEVCRNLRAFFVSFRRVKIKLVLWPYLLSFVRGVKVGPAWKNGSLVGKKVQCGDALVVLVASAAARSGYASNH